MTINQTMPQTTEIIKTIEPIKTIENPPHLASQTIFQFAVSIGEALLESGGEIFRVQGTIERVLRYYGIFSYQVFVLSNGIFATVLEGTPEQESIVRNVPLGSIHLGKIARLNQLSRDICDGMYSLDEAYEKLEEVKAMPRLPLPVFILIGGMGSGAFCYLMKGGVREMAVAFVLGIALQSFLAFTEHRKASKFLAYILGGFLITTICLALKHFGFTFAEDTAIIGTITIMVPGVALTTSIRELFMGDYLSGCIKLMDAVLTGMCIATGVGTAFLLPW
ncbi:membrane protein [Clostridia bacterium]|nr:membrane protein [Clostridia bacterium]